MQDAELLITAELAYVALNDAELAVLRQEVDAMVSYFKKMEELDVTGLEPTTHALGQGNRSRADEVGTSTLADKILEQSPDLEDRFVCIPNVL